jgi:glyoxylase-like metal-dependent hydrolase (beta-lactamase superfamily II)
MAATATPPPLNHPVPPLRCGRTLAWLRLAAAQCVALLVAACASFGTASLPPGDAVEVAAGVYMLRGAGGEVSTQNMGRVGNAGFIVGDDGVLAIDTGTSYRHGVALLAAIARVTDKPVRRVVITHTRQEFLFGATAFRERGIAIQMQRQAALLMRARCENCLKTLNRVLGEEAMHGSAVIVPDIEFNDSQTLTLIGRPLRLLTFGHSSGPGDTAVFDERSGVLFAGGLLDEHRIPDIQDSDLAGWKQALAALRALPITRVVPGHGPVASPGVVDSIARYLDQLQARMAALMHGGAALSEAADLAVLPEFTGWDQYETIHRRNASVMYIRLERELLFK